LTDYNNYWANIFDGRHMWPGNAVPTVKITLGTPFPGVRAGNDPCWRYRFLTNVIYLSH